MTGGLPGEALLIAGLAVFLALIEGVALGAIVSALLAPAKPNVRFRQPAIQTTGQPPNLHKEERKMKTRDLHKMSVEEISAFVHTDEGQDEITAFTDWLREEVGSPEKWLAACQGAEKEAESFGLETLRRSIDLLGPFIQVTPPGHDPNHLRRDLLSDIALSTDSFVRSAAFRSDVVAGILAGAFHDIGNAVTRRYEDRKRKAGHGEDGAWLTFNALVDLVGPNTAKMMAYGVAAHTHYPKPVPVEQPQGFTRQPYWYGIEYLDVEGSQKPYGLAPILARYCDRLDLAGGATHCARHFTANADSAEEGGEEFTGEVFFQFKEGDLVTLFLPQVREGGPKPATVLEWMKLYSGSGFHRSIYSQDDHLFPVMVELMLTRSQQARELTTIVTGSVPNMSEFVELRARARVKDTLRQISGSPHFERSWAVLKRAWDKLTPEIQARWEMGFTFIQATYIDWLRELLSYASKSQEFAPLAEELVEACI